MVKERTAVLANSPKAAPSTTIVTSLFTEVIPGTENQTETKQVTVTAVKSLSVFRDIE